MAHTANAQSGDWSLIRPGLAAIAGRTRTAAAVWFTRPDGSYFTVQAGLTGASLSDRTYFPRLMAGKDVLGDLVVSKSTGEPSAIVATPVWAHDTVIGALGASIDLFKLSALLQRVMNLPPGMVFYAIDSHGETAIHSDPMNVLAFPSNAGSRSLVTAVQKMLHSRRGSVSYDYNGAKTVLFMKSEQSGWVFALGLARSRQ